MGCLWAFAKAGAALTYVPGTVTDPTQQPPDINQQWVPSWLAQSYTEPDSWLAYEMLTTPLYTGTY